MIDFKKRLAQITRKSAEHEAAIHVYERLLTARIICAEQFGPNFSEATAIAVLAALCDECSLQRGILGLDEKPDCQ